MPVDKIALSDKLTTVAEHVAGGKIRATSLAWNEAYVLKPDQILVVLAIGPAAGRQGGPRLSGRHNKGMRDGRCSSRISPMQ